MNTGRSFWMAACLLSPSVCAAAEPSQGCDAFKWPVAHEQTALLSPQKHLTSGETLPVDAAATLRLLPFAEVTFAKPPERKPKDPSSFAGWVKIDAVKVAGTYKMTLSDAAWLEVLEDGQALKPAAFSASQDCPGVRKTVKFHLAAKPVMVQLSDAKVREVSLILSPE